MLLGFRSIRVNFKRDSLELSLTDRQGHKL